MKYSQFKNGILKCSTILIPGHEWKSSYEEERKRIFKSGGLVKINEGGVLPYFENFPSIKKSSSKRRIKRALQKRGKKEWERNKCFFVNK